ncbi:SDR family oxidoreductase [Deinococcus psychrotolerans]|uniref:SDR family oxidoreductase n=1 Tax=Deinococcus psychrotolerans TaxID=2489213 RepID=A0A3G8YKA8_9DEIO|nr:SDR family NAD(P)-dependent oxidoreductase [Deinococcus psychrotolerans]AZI42964.1 SDR family oxidoreductase [Deinococcus psychrotolerans]
MKPYTALVTGGARGIGRGVALALAGAGYHVAVQYRSSAEDAAETAQLCRELGVQADTFQAELTDPDQAAAVVEWAHRRFETPLIQSPLGVLVNVVGNYVHRRWDQTTPDEWNDMLGSNLSATFYTCRVAVPLMRGNQPDASSFGRVVNFGYAGAQNLLARPGVVPYAAAKAGVIALTKAIARTEAQYGISANVVSPGVIETSVSQPLTEIPAGRLGTVDEVARAVMTFVEGSAYLTGQVLEVSGGWNL